MASEGRPWPVQWCVWEPPLPCAVVCVLTVKFPPRLKFYVGGQLWDRLGQAGAGNIQYNDLKFRY